MTSKVISSKAPAAQPRVKKSPLKRINTFKKLRKELLEAMAPSPERPRVLEGIEIEALVTKALASGPKVAEKVKLLLAEGLATASIHGRPLLLDDEALGRTAAFAGVSAATYHTALRALDGTATHALAEGLAKEKQQVSDAEVAATKKQLLLAQGPPPTEIPKREFTPEFRAAQGIQAAIQTAGETYPAGDFESGDRAAVAVNHYLEEMLNEKVTQLQRDPAARERVQNVLGALGQAGMRDAMAEAAPELADTFACATGIHGPSPYEIVESLPETMTRSPEVGYKLGKAVIKLGLDANSARKAGGIVKHMTTIKPWSQLTKGGKALKIPGLRKIVLPGAANLLCFGGAVCSAANFFYVLFDKPRSGELIAREGLGTLLQTAGIFCPAIGAAGDVMEGVWTAKMAVQDEKSVANLDPEKVGPLVSQTTHDLATALEEQGHPDEADAFTALADALESSASKEETEALVLAAMFAFSGVAASHTEAAAGEEPDPEVQDALRSVAHGFSELYAVLHQQRRTKSPVGAKREDLMARLTRVVYYGALGKLGLVASEQEQAAPETGKA